MIRQSPRVLLALLLTAATVGVLAGGAPVAPRAATSIAKVAAARAEMAISIPDPGVARRRLRHARARLALPYFSFALGLGRAGS